MLREKGREGKSEKLTIPGETIAVIEEFFAGDNTYLMNGDIISKILGRIIADINKRVIKVEPLKRLYLPEVNEVVYGRVVTIRDPIAFLDVIYVENRNKPLLKPLSGILHVNNVSSSYVKSLYEVIGYGDVVRAWVMESRTLPLELSIKGREFGVIFSNCPYCMTPLKKRGFNLFCNKCKKSFKKKVSPKYLL